MDKRKLATTLLAAASLTTSAASLKAVNFPEPGDAGQTIGTAANTGLTAGTTLTSITGTIGTSTDADLYILSVAAGTTVTATTSSSAGIDTSIFLFNSTGAAVLANDDLSGTSFNSSFTFTLAAGTYYFGIALSGNEPVNSNNQLLFTLDQPTTGVRGAAAGVNPTTLSTFNGGTFFAETGAYTVTFAAVPEPTTNVALGLGGIASLVFLRRMRRQQKA